MGALGKATSAAKMASANALKRAKAQFASKISMLTNVIAANAKRAEKGLQRVTGVVHNEAKAAKADRQLIREQRSAMEADLKDASSCRHLGAVISASVFSPTTL